MKKYIIFLALCVFIFLPASSMAANFYWVGANGANTNVNTNWATVASSCGSGTNPASAPSTSDTIYFVSNCTNSANIPATVTFAGINMGTGYTGTVSQTAGAVITIGSFVQAAGTYSATESLTINGSTFTKSGGTFSAGSGTITFAASTTTNISIGTTETFNNVTIAMISSNGIIFTAGNVLGVSGTLTLTGGRMINGTINAQGNITQASTYGYSDGTTVLNFSNDSVAQTYTVNGGIGLGLNFDSAADANDSIVINANATFYGLTIASGFGSNTVPINFNGNGSGPYTLTLYGGGFSQSAGTFNAPGSMTLTGNFTKSGGTFNPGTGTVVFNEGFTAVFDVATTETLYNVNINMQSTNAFTTGSGDTMVVNGTLTLTSGRFYSGNIIAMGNIVQESGYGFSDGAGIIDFGNDSVAQTYTLKGGIGNALRYDSAADANDTVVMNANATLYSLTLTSGVGAGTVAINNNGNGSGPYTLTITTFSQAGGTFTEPSALTVGTYTQTGGIFTALSSLNVTGNFTMGGGTFVGPGGMTLSKNISLTGNSTFQVDSGTFTESGIISGAYNLTKTGAGILTLSGVNTFSNGLTIKAGTVIGTTSNNAFGANTNVITLGDSSGTTGATLSGSGSARTYPQPITVASGSSGVLKLSAANSTFSGAITLNNNLTVDPDINKIVISGGITGTGNLLINNVSTGGLNAIQFVTNPLNFAGTITNTGTGSYNTYISSVIGTNVTGVIQNSSTSGLYLAGANTFTSGITIKAGVLQGSTSLRALGGVGGIVTLGDSSGTTDATLDVASTFVYSNPITVASGSSTNTLKIMSSAGAPELSGVITLNNNATIYSSTASNIIFSGGTTGTGNIVIDNTNSGSITFQTGAINHTGTLANSGTGAGAVAISSTIGSNVTSVTQSSTTSPLLLTANNTIAILALGADTTTTITSGRTITLTNLVSTGTSGHLAIINSSSAGSAASLTTASSIIFTNYLSLKDLTPVQTSTWYAGVHSTSVSNTGNWIFAVPPNRYWVGGTGNWSDAAHHWAIISNGQASVDYALDSTAVANFDSYSCATSCTSTIDTDQTISSLNLNNSNTTISSSGNLTLSGSFTKTSGTFNGGSKTLTLSGASSTISGGGSFNNLSVTAPTALNLTGVTIAGELTMTGGATITGAPTLNTGSTVTYTSTSGTRSIQSWTYTGSTLKINGSGGTFTLPADLVVAGINIVAGTLDLNGHNLTDSGDFTNAGGSLAAGTKTVTLSGSNPTVNCGTGGTTFYGLTFTPGQTVTFTAGKTCTINGTLTATGSAGNIINLKSGSLGSAVTFTTTKPLQSGDYLNITDVNTTQQQVWYAGSHSTLVSNTNYWISTAPPDIWSGSGNCSTPANWASGSIPQSGDTIYLGANGTSNMTWDASCPATVGSFTMDSGYSGIVTLGQDLNINNNFTHTGGTFTSNGKTVTLAGTAQAVDCGAGGTTFDNITFTPGQTITFAHGRTCTINGAFTATGTSGHVITMQSDSAGSAFTFSKSSGNVDVSYCSIKDSTATGGASWLAPTRQNNLDVSGNTGWAFNSHPEFDTSFGTSGINISQVSNINDAHLGYIKIDYRTYDPDTTGGSVQNAGFITPSFKYKNGGSWTTIDTQYLDAGDLDRKAVVETADGATTYSAFWNAKSQLPGIYSTTVQVQITSNDGETSNSIGTAESAQFALDTKAPNITNYVLDAGAHTFTLGASDDNNVSYRISTSTLPDSVSSVPSWTDVNAVTVSATPTIPADESSQIVYLQVKDIFGNYSSKSIVAPSPISNFSIKDTSNLPAGNYREFLSWKTYVNATGATFARYEIQRASGNPLSSFSQLTTISQASSNLYTDNTTQNGTNYGYKIRVIDSDGDSSPYSSVLQDVVDGQGGTDTTPPIISGVNVSKTNATWVKIAWTTDEPANSTVKYSVHQKDVAPAYDQTALDASYDLSHVVQITGLDPSTTYDYKVSSADISSNSAEDDKGGAGYQFATTAGASISDVAATPADTTAIIIWATSKLADSHIIFAQDASSLTTYQQSGSGNAQDVSSDNPVTSHRITLSGLTPKTTYYYYVKSADADGNTSLDDNNSSYYTFTTTYDITPPVISSIKTPVITSSNVIVTWATDELSDSQIIYGTASGKYDKQTSLDTLLTINHVATLSGLDASTKYYYVIKSADANNNQASSGEQTVSTLDPGQINVNNQISGVNVASSGGGGGGGMSNNPLVILDTTPPIISNVKVTSDQPFGAEFSFNTNEMTTGFVSYGTTTNYGSILADLHLGLSHTFKINNLKMGTTYHFMALATDGSGNTSQDKDVTATTKFVAEALKDLKSFNDVSQFQDQLENLIQSVLPSLSAPVVTDVKVTDVSETGATISWKTNVPAYDSVDYTISDKYSSKADKPYDQNFGQATAKTTDHTIKLTSLVPSTSYHFRVSSYSLPGVIGYGNDMTFATKTANTVSVSKVGNNDFQVQWQTLQKTTSIVEFTDPVTGKIKRTEDSTPLQLHAISVSDLVSNTSYSVHAFGYDADNNLIEGGSITVKTTKDSVPPVISNIRINSALLPSQTNLLQTVISWATDEPATSQVFYDEGVSKGDILSKSVSQDGLTTQHILIVPSLKPSTVYRFRIESKDQAGNLTRSPIKTVLTPEQAENVVDVIMKNLQESFGFLQKLSK